MLKILFPLIFSCSVIGAAAMSTSAPATPHIGSPVVAMERQGMYRITLSEGIIEEVKENLKRAFETAEERMPRPLTTFEVVLNRSRYPLPGEFDCSRKIKSKISEILFQIRNEYSLPLFETHKYTSIESCIEAFETFLLTQLPGEENKDKREEIKDKISQKIKKMHEEVESHYAIYRSFYEAQRAGFNPHTLEAYVKGLLDSEGAGEPKENILAILIGSGFLTILGNLEDGKFTYSPRSMVESYISSKGQPSVIVLGCSHASAEKTLEFFGLPRESWCGSCEDLPHIGAMVVSLHEPTADVLCDLNDPDLWAPLTTASVDSIRDETWSLSCYKPETLDSIARVLRIGGEFSSNGYGSSLGIKDAMITRGFEVVEEDIERRILKMRKVR